MEDSNLIENEANNASTEVIFRKIIIVGAGFAGLGMGINLLKKGEDSFLILERADRVGGTWRENTYPGAACDVSSFVYSYSFEPWAEWTRLFSPQKDIFRYLQHCTQKYGLEPFLHFNTSVNGGEYDEEKEEWKLRTKEGKEYRCKVLITGTGPLNKPSVPDFEGAKSFKGPSFHSSRWNHNFDHKGKRIAVIGTGASAIQIVPAIAQEVKELVLFQRSAAWVVPRADRPIPKFERAFYRMFPFVQTLTRTMLYWIYETTGIPFLRNPGWFNRPQKFFEKRIRKIISDPVKQEKLVPNYTMGCKRILVSSEYYPAVDRKNVILETETIERITETGIVTNEGTHHDVDAIVFATGFEAAENQAPFPFTGRGGVDLQEMWAEGGEAYLGTTVHGFPNLFVIIGPNTGLGHNSMIHVMESQMTYILDALKTMEEKNKQSIEVKQSVQEAYNVDIQDKMKSTVWSNGSCKSWYLNKAGKVTTLYPGFTWEFRKSTKRFRMEDYS